MQLYNDKPSDYYSHARMEIASVLPPIGPVPLKALEVGCAQGHTLNWLKQSGLCDWVAGVEPYADLDPTLTSIDQFEKINIESQMPKIHENSLDLILCLDVLEHLVDPWNTMHRLNGLLKPGGKWIISVPNIQNYRAVFSLLFLGKFQYTDAGILDRTHLRFFTRRTLCEMVSGTGTVINSVTDAEPKRWQKKLLLQIGLGDLLAKQWLLVATKK
jgi:2-polyprenyl-3-methyl-5-hydroxy-6-metoxy-1,4-benzoquinol methylase